jgi:orotidine-5'-phosphate decarboxylase
MFGKVVLKKPVFVALDLDDPSEVLKLAEKLKDYVGGFKIGPRLSVQMGGEWTKKLAKLAPLFIDNKYFDIPNTMEHAVRATFDAGASFCTVHALAGSEALKRLAKVEAELNKIRPFQILAISILTSWDENSKPSIIKNDSIATLVNELADLVWDSGLSGLVCSPFEATEIKKQHPKMYCLTPGIRFPGDSAADQKRIMTPDEALKSGSDCLVLGRSILDSTDPIKLLKSI